ncbi:hypothetical protein [Ligilactobacillus salivarius]|uniref:Uncharacterized protein n=1 Tax=Ligilactobacillus salivarius TaxID=1624 RepID=A0AAW7N5Z8_9LACO|nr:hypothetical protein [Ligilactobacillus salivarius]MDN4833501.1 hypothetical protein [Ligilactobacillus salivarius]UDE98079.1 hypothetical protein LG631_03970 [Ligilactobacillus salivarius]UUV97088.1 hypothetical protein M3M92_03970 [Ligilactobacillus salivarius]
MLDEFVSSIFVLNELFKLELVLKDSLKELDVLRLVDVLIDSFKLVEVTVLLICLLD